MGTVDQNHISGMLWNIGVLKDGVRYIHVQIVRLSYIDGVVVILSDSCDHCGVGPSENWKLQDQWKCMGVLQSAGKNKKEKNAQSWAKRGKKRRKKEEQKKSEAKKKDAQGKVSAPSQILVADIAAMAFSTATHKHLLWVITL